MGEVERCTDARATLEQASRALLLNHAAKRSAEGLSWWTTHRQFKDAVCCWAGTACAVCQQPGEQAAKAHQEWGRRGPSHLCSSLGQWLQASRLEGTASRVTLNRKGSWPGPGGGPCVTRPAVTTDPRLG